MKRREYMAISNYAILVFLSILIVLIHTMTLSAASSTAPKMEAVSVIAGATRQSQFNTSCTIEECENGDIKELILMEDEAIGGGDDGKYIVYDITRKRGPFCDAHIYQSCIRSSKNARRPSRACTVYNFCDRGRPGF
ncbi:hypothetical protein CsatB_021044 [Cannabis sativa]